MGQEKSFSKRSRATVLIEVFVCIDVWCLCSVVSFLWLWWGNRKQRCWERHVSRDILGLTGVRSCEYSLWSRAFRQAMVAGYDRAADLNPLGGLQHFPTLFAFLAVFFVPVAYVPFVIAGALCHEMVWVFYVWKSAWLKHKFRSPLLCWNTHYMYISNWPEDNRMRYFSWDELEVQSECVPVCSQENGTKDTGNYNVYRLFTADEHKPVCSVTLDFYENANALRTRLERLPRRNQALSER